MSRLLLLGIDALDRELLDRLAADLPNLSALRHTGLSLKVRSTFPPDSDTAWATISTGLNPAQHGIVRFIDPLEKSYQITNVGADNDVLRGRTFWESAGKAGKKTYAIFPHLGYPVWSVPGVMVARGTSTAAVQATDPDVLSLYPDPNSLLGVRGFPDRSIKGMAAYRDQLVSQALADAEFAQRLMRRDDWELFFVYWSTIDAVGHFFWSYFDQNDPGYQPAHPLEPVIPTAYRLFDEIVGRFLAAVGDDTTVIVLSDHGHSGRPFTLVNVNEILRQAGWLTAHATKTNPQLYLLEKSKCAAVWTVSRYGLAKPAGHVLRRFPGVMKTFTRPASIDWERTVACATDLSGIKAYPYGGIRINRELLDGRDYERVRSEIIALMEQRCVLPSGESLLRFIARREDLYCGPFISSYPDIVLELKHGYGVGWGVDVPLITRAASRNLVPGSHRGETGTFIMRGARPPMTDFVDLRDVAPTVLDLLGVAPAAHHEGRSILVDGRLS